MNTMDVIYPNMANLFSECPMKFYYKYIEQISSPMLEQNFITGKNIHALSAYYLKGLDITKLVAVLTPKEKEMWEYLKTNEYFNLTPIGVEKNILKRFGKYWLGGRLDAIMKKDKNLYIIDYKTGGVKSDMIYDYQTMIYCLLCDDVLSEYNSLTFIYIDLKNKKNVKIDFNKTLQSQYEKRLLKTCDDIADFNPKKFKKPENCNCVYSKICML